MTTDYVGGYQYENNELQFFPQPEGYVAYKNNTFEYIYQYKDHLGNIRLSYQDKLKDGTVDNTDIIEESSYYPFGLKQQRPNNVVNSFGNSAAQKYKYNGKELQDELGLNLYDYGARNYDPALGKWMNIDPLAEMSRKWSPYNYAYNNPLKFTDPDGMLPEDKVEKDEEKVSEKQLDADAKENEEINNNINKGFKKYLESQKNQEEEEKDPPNPFMEFLEKLFRMPNSDEEAEESHFWQDFMEDSSKYIEKVGGAFQTAMMVVFPTPGGGSVAALETVGSKGLLRIINQSKGKINYQVLRESSTASSFYKTLNPGWNGVMTKVDDLYSTTSFTAKNGIRVTLSTTSSSTGMPTIKIAQKGYEIMIRFPHF
jgi:RHS repeat-associated protein